MRGTRQGRTIKLRLEGRLLCLWGLLDREVSLERGELSLLPLTDLGPQPSVPTGVLGPPASLSWAGGADGQKAGLTRKLPVSPTRGWTKREPCEWSWGRGGAPECG